MNRPLFNDSIETLEVKFQERANDEDFLKFLSFELSFRSTDRAKRLQAQVDLVLKNGASDLKVVATASSDLVHLQKLPSYSLADYPPTNVKIDLDRPLTNKGSDILSSWIAMEVLSPQTFRRELDLASATNGSIAQIGSANLPWEGEGETSIRNYRLYYQIVLGTIDFSKAIDALLNVYIDKRIERPTAKGEAILAVAVVDSNGMLLESPAVVVSSFAWGLPIALAGGLDKLGGWMDVEADLTDKLDSLLRKVDSKGKELSLDKFSIDSARNYLVSHLRIPSELVTSNCFAVRTFQHFTNPEPPEPLLLNSFYLGDLLTAAEKLKLGKLGGNLLRFLGLKVDKQGRDILGNQLVLEQSIAPLKMPSARWPGPNRHPLVVMQQAAVNIALSELKVDGILAVNGPPGTGKTTLLRDVVAGLVTKRAQALMEFDNPEDAFIDSNEQIKVGQGFFRLYNLDPRIKGFEMLIASSNNKAVENVSAELPARKAIAADAHELRYFTCLSDTLLKRESWGLIAAVLGNAQNRYQFRNTFWWDKEVGMSTYLTEVSGRPQLIDTVDAASNLVIGTHRPKIVEEADAPHSLEVAKDRWRKARHKMKSVLDDVNKKLKTLDDLRQTLFKLEVITDAEIQTRSSLGKAKDVETSSREEVQRAQESFDELKKIFDIAEDENRQHREIRPGILARIFRTVSYRLWKQKHNIFTAAEAKAKGDMDDSFTALDQLRNTLSKNSEYVRKAEKLHSSALQTLRKAQLKIGQAREQFGEHIIDNQFFRLAHREQNLVSPWCDAQTQRLRDDVFIAAIQVQKAFIDAAAKPLKHNLGVLMNVFAGKKFTDVKKTALMPDLWSSLFLVVPSVSTTFASVERMLGKIPPESLGWLVVDEAGQALPQAAVGALMRTQKAIVVGDPLQIEPVVVLPDTLTENICRRFGVDPDRFNAPGASVQTLADAATSYFGEFEGRNGSRRVGVPLLVHRRCEEPMFGVSNAIAYERQMVQAKTKNTSSIKDCIGASCWFDVQGTGVEKWCPEEGMVVLNLMKKLKAGGVKPDLYIVTPFVVVADNLRREIRNSAILKGWVDDHEKWPSERVGTVHTVQGREAEAVIFILGAPLPEQTGARGWAGSRPNILNVAVTRAKEVLYVVGNRQLWSNAGLFSELSNRL